MTGEGLPEPAPALSHWDAPDRRDGRGYLMHPRIELAVDVALATGRPLLLRGEPGSGKSSLAAHIALTKEWRYYEQVVTSRTQGRDLLWTYDHVRRLGDAQVRRPGSELDDDLYVTPGPLWWAFDPVSAAGRSGQPRVDPWAEVNETRRQHSAVVLIDEIDKADPDMPNSLLVPLGSNRFTVQETGEEVTRQVSAGGAEPGRHLVIITTNEERELPQAFLRRCVVLKLDDPGRDRLVEIAAKHFTTAVGTFTSADRALAEELADALLETRTHAREKGLRPPSTAEFLDALRACKELAIDTGHPDWAELKKLTLLKPQQPEA
ncbi:ATPase [Streptomyces sp. Act143]|uniref:AAA family ATPase n=1 Tax=Streptomyces sp. Act143 TaxID=2200760 RepID=UPI000D6738C7|nr:MoxR family ATPase [Streptomyces sp. Act143]PWI14566.1 ATPase [Streptomyces sp. Act143]